jgi:hypothetical protein
MVLTLVVTLNGCEAIKECCQGKSCDKTEQAGTCTNCGGTSCNKNCSAQTQTDTTQIKN